MNPPLLAIGFDLDYTLWDQDAFAHSFYRAIAGPLGAAAGLPWRDVHQAFLDAQRCLTLGHPGLFDAALRSLGIWDPDRVAQLVDQFHAHRPRAEAYPGAEAVLAGLARAQVALFLVTDGHPAVQRHKVTALGIGRWFQSLVFTGEFQPGLQKPSCFPFLHACAQLGVEPSRCAYVGDNPQVDFRGAQQLGMLTVGVSTGPFAGKAATPDCAPHRRIHSLLELEGLL